MAAGHGAADATLVTHREDATSFFDLPSCDDALSQDRFLRAPTRGAVQDGKSAEEDFKKTESQTGKLQRARCQKHAEGPSSPP